MQTSSTTRRLSLETRLAVLAVANAIALLAFAALLERLVGLSRMLGPTAASGFLLVTVIAATRVAAFHPFDRLGPANWVTMLRTTLVALVSALVLEVPAPSVATTAVVVASVAASLDGWDGWLARRTHMASAFGARFDMEIDALLILILGVFAWRYDKAGAWILLSGALRYIFVAAGWGLGWLRQALPPSTRRKAVCVIQIVGLIVAIAPLVGRPLSAAVGAITLALLGWSFAVDVLWLWRVQGLERPTG